MDAVDAPRSVLRDVSQCKRIEKVFIYPVVDKSLCIDCHLCENVCPETNPGTLHSDAIFKSKIYGIKNMDRSVCLNSSSGGVFNAIANKIINENGVVFGAIINNKCEVVHTCATSSGELAPMMKSKYVQSRIDNCYSEVKQLLKSGKKVLFTGTPCQIAGLKSFLQKNYQSLYTAEIICHGVPSPGIWKKYLNEITSNDISQIREISFREKKDYSWYNCYFVVKGDNDHIIVSEPTGDNQFIRVFLSNVSIRPICYECHHKGGRSGADLTLGDFWGIDELSPDFYDRKGVSLIITHSEKGEYLIKQDILDRRLFPDTDATRLNKAYSESVTKPYIRKRFFNFINKDGLSIAETVCKVIPRQSELSAIQKIVHLPYRIIGLISRKLHIK